MVSQAAEHRPVQRVREKKHMFRKSGKGGTDCLSKSRGHWVEDGRRQKACVRSESGGKQ